MKDKPAFPFHEQIRYTKDGTTLDDIDHGGMSIREYAAIKAMQGILSNPGNWGDKVGQMASWSVEQADALLNELSKKGE